MALGYNLLWLHISVDVAKYRKRKIIRFQHAGRAKDKKARTAAEIRRSSIIDGSMPEGRLVELMPEAI